VVISISTCTDYIDEVVELYCLSVEYDYLLRVVVPDAQAYDQICKKMNQKVKLSNVSYNFAMEK